MGMWPAVLQGWQSTGTRNKRSSFENVLSYVFSVCCAVKRNLHQLVPGGWPCPSVSYWKANQEILSFQLTTHIDDYFFCNFTVLMHHLSQKDVENKKVDYFDEIHLYMQKKQNWPSCGYIIWYLQLCNSTHDYIYRLKTAVSQCQSLTTMSNKDGLTLVKTRGLKEKLDNWYWWSKSIP